MVVKPQRMSYIFYFAFRHRSRRVCGMNMSRPGSRKFDGSWMGWSMAWENGYVTWYDSSSVHQKVLCPSMTTILKLCEIRPDDQRLESHPGSHTRPHSVPKIQISVLRSRVVNRPSVHVI